MDRKSKQMGKANRQKEQTDMKSEWMREWLDEKIEQMGRINE